MAVVERQDTDWLTRALAETADAVSAAMTDLLPPATGPRGELIEAMRYACLGGGKRLRPFLLVHSASLFDVPPQVAMRPAAVIEMLHTYSLVHDDLPAMDDSDLRRGRATVHKVYNDATAILVGDGLLTLAFEILAHSDTHPAPAVRADLVLALAKAAGEAGMVGGQMIDLSPERETLDLEGIIELQSLKTGALIQFSCAAGGILGGAGPSERAALEAYARDIGLAFQIVDDLLDIEGTAEDLGKPAGQDAEAGKATFVALLGLEEARRRAHDLVEQSIGHLAQFGPKADPLRATARFVVERKH